MRNLPPFSHEFIIERFPRYFIRVDYKEVSNFLNLYKLKFKGGRPPHAHPAAAASMHAHARTHQNQAVGGGSRGGFAWLLPFYTIGVVLFLLYTLFRVSEIFIKRNVKEGGIVGS